MKAHAEVVQRDDELVIISYSWTDLGWTSNGWSEIQPVEIGAELLGQSILDALASSAIKIPTPGRGDRPFLPVLTKVGCKTYKQFTKGAFSVGFTIEDDTWIATPDVNVTPAGFKPAPAHSESGKGATEVGLGEAAYRGLMASRVLTESAFS
jgi:hypothetical protein